MLLLKSRENTFAFWTDYLDFDDLRATDQIRKTSKDLMSYSEDDWKDDVPTPIRDSTFAAFIRKIGPNNSSYIRHIRFSSPDTEKASSDIFIATNICEYHPRGLERFQLHVYEKDIFMDESPYYYHPDMNSPFWANGYVFLQLTVTLYLML